MTVIDFEFEELEPMPGLCVLVSGSAEIVGEWEGPDRSVGIMRGCWSYYVDAVYIDSTKKGEPSKVLNSESLLYGLICKELEQGSLYYDLIQAKFEEMRE